MVNPVSIKIEDDFRVVSQLPSYNFSPFYKYLRLIYMESKDTLVSRGNRLREFEFPKKEVVHNFVVFNVENARMFFHESLVGNVGRKAKKNPRFISRTINFSVPEEFS